MDAVQNALRGSAVFAEETASYDVHVTFPEAETMAGFDNEARGRPCLRM